MLFRKTPVDRLTPNRLVLRIQPKEGISLHFGAKVPGPLVRLGAMDFDYSDYFESTPSTGYERLLYDCMTGDATLFRRADMVEAGWSVAAPIPPENVHRIQSENPDAGKVAEEYAKTLREHFQLEAGQ